MSTGTTEIGNQSRAHSAVWLATAVGASIGIAALAYSRRRPRGHWDRARNQTSHLIDSAREEIKPWMGVAAGTAAAAGSALAIYLRNRKESGWQRATRRASEIATHLGAQATNPWANLAATAAIGLVSVAYGNKVRRRTIRGIDRRTADRINALTEKGAEVLRRFRNISEEAAKLYPAVRRTMA